MTGSLVFFLCAAPFFVFYSQARRNPNFTNPWNSLFLAEVHSLERVPANGIEVPIHVVIDNTRDPSRFAAWVYAHDGRPVENPLFAMLASAPRQLLCGSQPFTILMVDGILLGEDPAPIVESAKRWLGAAWEHFAQACL